MTIDEAIRHCEEKAAELDVKAMCVEEAYQTTEQQNCEQCAAEHRQIAEWLTDYKELKNSIGAVKLELLKEAQAELEKRGKMLHDTIAELEEAKRLLKAAVKDINFYVDCYEAHCDECCCDHDNHCHWKHEAEALKLIGENEHE